MREGVFAQGSTPSNGCGLLLGKWIFGILFKRALPTRGIIFSVVDVLGMPH